MKANEERMGSVRSTLRQYGYKGKGAPSEAVAATTPVTAMPPASPKPATVLDEADEADEQPEQVAEQETERETEQVVAAVVVETEDEDSAAIVVGGAQNTSESTDDAAIPASPSTPPNPSSSDFRTPRKPWEEVEARTALQADTPDTPATPTLEAVGLTAEVIKSALKPKPIEFHHQLLSTAAKSPPKPTLMDRIKSLHETIGSASKPTKSKSSAVKTPRSVVRSALRGDVRASLPAPASNTKLNIARGSISFATSTSFNTQQSNRRAYVSTPNSKQRNESLRASLPVTPSHYANPGTPVHTHAVHTQEPVAETEIEDAVSPLAHESPQANATNFTPAASAVAPSNPARSAASVASAVSAASAVSNNSETSSLATPEMPATIVANSLTDPNPTSASTTNARPLPTFARDIEDEANDDEPEFVLPKTPLAKHKQQASPNTERIQGTPEEPTFVMPKTPLQAHKQRDDSKQMKVDTPPTPPAPSNLSMSCKKAVREVSNFDSPEMSSPAVPRTQRSTVKKPSAGGSPLTSQMQAFSSPLLSSPEVPKMARSTVKKSKEDREEASEKRLAFESPDLASPIVPQMSTIKKPLREDHSTPVAQEKLGFGSPEVSTPEEPAMLRSTVKKSRNGTNLTEESPPAVAAAERSSKSPETPETPGELETSLTTSFVLSNKKDLAREFNNTPSSLGSPDALTPPVPPMSSAKKRRTPLNMSPPGTPLLASASKKKLDASAKKGKQGKLENEAVAAQLFGKVEEEEDQDESSSSSGSVGPSVPPIRIISDEEYTKAPRLVQMQAKKDGLNAIVPKFDRWFMEAGRGAEMDEEIALELAGKKMMLMGLCHFGRLVMGSKDGKKTYKPSGV
jgi:hypothetical protein